MALTRQSSQHKLFFIFIITFIIAIQCNCLIRKKRIVGGWNAAKPPEDDPVVFINKNNRDSRIYGKRDPDKGFYVFKGIRFAEPPIGRNRFQRAQAIHLDGEYNATRWAPPCPQEYRGKIIGSEDCLFLNVFTPQLPNSDDGYPVLIWIHGGGFKIGAACQYEMRNLIKKKLIVVSIQYRLGSLGFLSTGAAELPGNNGMFDMIVAVNWVKQYIKYFGGNPNKITAFGHGTGASAALMLSLSTLTNNYFSGLIAMSGSLLSNFVFDKNPMDFSKTIAINNNCPYDNITNMIHCLQELSIETIINGDTKIANFRIAAKGFLSGITDLLVSGPVVEGGDDLRSLPNFMTDTPENFLKFDKLPSIPLLTGVMKDESGGAIFGGYSNKLLESTRTITNYVENKKELLINLQEKIPIIGNNSKQFVLKAFDKYLNNDNVKNINMGLNNIVKAINDAIFNVPAFLTADYWSKKAKTYFYSFDYISKNSYKNNFLNGLPIVDAKNSQNRTNSGHGDDLSFIFGENDIFGNKIQENQMKNNEDDERVSEIFTDMIVQFARIGTIDDNKQSKSNKDLSTLDPINSNNKPKFFSITDKLIPMKNYKFCEIALWTGASDQLSSSLCDSIRVTTETIERLTSKTKNILDLTNTSINSVGNVKNLGEKTIPPIVPNQINNTIKIINSNSSTYVPKIPGFGSFG